MLKSQVSTMLVVLQVVNQVQETLLPILLRRPSTRRMMNKFSKKMEDRSKKSAAPPQAVKVTGIYQLIMHALKWTVNVSKKLHICTGF